MFVSENKNTLFSIVEFFLRGLMLDSGVSMF